MSAIALRPSLLGMVNWIYQWYRPEGALNEDELVRQYSEIFFRRGFPVKHFNHISELEVEREQRGKLYLEFLRVSSMSAGLYVFVAGQR
jgi:hypothetical protein